MREMKDSGIEWIWEIPCDWTVVRSKYVFTHHKIIVGDKAGIYDRLSLTKKGISKRSKDDISGLQPEKFDTYQIVYNNELVFRLIDMGNISSNRVGLSPYIGIISAAYTILSCNEEVLPDFAEKWFLSMSQRLIFNFLRDDGVRSGINTEDLLNVKIALPTKNEQRSIANFLNCKCAAIDAIVSDIENEIEILKAYKQSLITETVTKGLDPDVEMKDSGVEWIGKVPSHWEINRGKYILTCVQRQVKKNDEIITCFRDGEVTLRNNRRTEGFTMSDKENGYQGIEQGDLVVHGMDGFAGAIGIADARGKGSPVLIVLDTNQSKQYIMYYLRFLAYNNVFSAISTGIRIRSCELSWSKLSELEYLIPPLKEQLKISEYIDTTICKINDTISRKQCQMEALVEYRKSMIYEYVTGKKEAPSV